MQFSYFSKLNQREKYYLIAGFIAITALCLYHFVWAPLTTSNQNLFQQINQQEELRHWMEIKQIEIEQYTDQQTQTQAQAQAQDEEPLFTTIENTLQANMLDQLAIQLSSRDSNSVQIQIDQIEFDSLVGWLINLQEQYGIRISQATFNRIVSAPGFIQASATLERDEPH